MLLLFEQPLAVPSLFLFPFDLYGLGQYLLLHRVHFVLDALPLFTCLLDNLVVFIELVRQALAVRNWFSGLFCPIQHSFVDKLNLPLHLHPLLVFRPFKIFSTLNQFTSLPSYCCRVVRVPSAKLSCLVSSGDYAVTCPAAAAPCIVPSVLVGSYDPPRPSDRGGLPSRWDPF